MTTVLLYTLAAGACIPLGGLLAFFERIRPDWLENEFRHGVIAFGGGVLLAAVAFVLVPEGIVYMDRSLVTVLVLMAGGGCFFYLERLSGSHHNEKPQLLAMLLDYLPESLALGGIFAAGSTSAPLLALFIGLQNLPEGFNAYREQRVGQDKPAGRILGLMLMLAPLGAVLAVVGLLYLSEYRGLLGATMLFASGGILYLMFQDIAPQSRMQRHWAPPLGAVLGFCLGMLGHIILQGA